jgi:gluconokinase
VYGRSIDVQEAGDEVPYVLAIDVGTSSARAIVYDARGQKLPDTSAQRQYAPETTPDGGVVLDADALMDHVTEVVTSSLAMFDGCVQAVSCDTFWHSMLGLDEHDRPITPILTWADTRAAAAARDLRAQLDPQDVHVQTGAFLHPSYLPAKLLWLSRDDPETFHRVSSWVSFGEYLYLRLFGVRRVSISMASGTGLFNQHTCRWDEHVIDALPIEERHLWPIAEYTDACRGLRPEFKTRWPALDAVPWYLPLGDGACNNVGSGGVSETWAVMMVGTSGAVRVVRRVDTVRVPKGLWSYRVDAARVVQGGALSNGGNVFAWLESTLRAEPLSDIEAHLRSVWPDAHGLTVLPFLAGERSPDWNPSARAVFLGMSLDTTAQEIVRAALEGVAYRFGAVYDVLRDQIAKPGGIIASGAALARAPGWTQMMADVLGETVYLSGADEATSRGAALLGLEALGVVKSLETMDIPLRQRFEPEPDAHRTYAKARKRQEAVYTALSPFFQADPEIGTASAVYERSHHDVSH